jgi:hypothetical protein
MLATITEDRSRRATRQVVGNWTSDLATYRHEAAGVLDTHVSGSGRCTVCATAWPCRRVLAAEFVLEL